MFGRRFLLLTMLVVLVPAGVSADTFGFTSNNMSDSAWYWGGAGAGFSGSVLSGTMQFLGLTPVNIACSTCYTSWGTGAGSFVLPNLVTFSSSGSYLTIVGDIGSGPQTLMSGSFSSSSLNILSGGAPGQATFSASFVVGTIDPALLAFLGLPDGAPLPVSGAMTATLIGTFDESGGLAWNASLADCEGYGFTQSSCGSALGVQGATTSLTPVPEPATLVLLGTALLGLFGLRRVLAA